MSTLSIFRVALIKLLADFRDKRAEPALKKAFDEFAKQPTSKDDADINGQPRPTSDMKLRRPGRPDGASVPQDEDETMLGGIVYKDLNEAMVAVKDKGWVGPLDRQARLPSIARRAATRSRI